MGYQNQNWQGGALENLRGILFRPSAGIFALNRHVKDRSLKPRNAIGHIWGKYSKFAVCFLDEKDPPPTNYYKRSAWCKTTERPGVGSYAKDKVCTKLKKEKSCATEKPSESLWELLGQSRKGELPIELVESIWGTTPRIQVRDNKKTEAAANDLLCKVEKHVHAKYCEGAFGHFRLPDGTQIHGFYILSLRQLITELKALTSKLKAKLIHAAYKEVPVWRPPHLEEKPDFCPPEQEPLPQLYPVEGLLPLPEDAIPPDSPLPLLRTPQLKGYPLFTPPRFARKAAVLNMPYLPDFSKEEKSMEAFKQVPFPIFECPPQLPLPVWQDLQEEPLPPMPVNEVPKILQPLDREVIPPFQKPRMDARPCEAFYYTIEPVRASICDGLCGRKSGTAHGESNPCLARGPCPLPVPNAPVNDIVLDLPFPPLAVEEPRPTFIPPHLKPEPKYVEPSRANIPQWIPPQPPDPIGFLAGQKPVFLVDCGATMTAEGMNCAQNIMRFLFSKGGQVAIAATHFDIIMYSFDAWSYGTFEERQYKLSGGVSRHWVKDVETWMVTNALWELMHRSDFPCRGQVLCTGQVMQPKTPQNMEKALAWMSRWRTGGTSNLKKAIEVAMQLKSADCVYLLTHGKCDRPVIIMNTLKALQKERKLPPIYPVGLGSTKAQARILKNVVADITRGQYKELGLRWFFEAHTVSDVEVRGILSLKSGVEYWQRKALEEGKPESIDTILNRLKTQFNKEVMDPQLVIYRKEEERAKLQHKILLDRVREENNQIIAAVQKSFEVTHAAVLEKNRRTLEVATKSHEADMQNMRAANAQKKNLYVEWQKKVQEIQAVNEKVEKDARRKFAEDVRRIEEKNAYTLLHAKEEYAAQVKQWKEKNQLIIRNHDKEQETLVYKTKAKNEARWKAYEDKCADIKARNARNLESARAQFATSCEDVVRENRQRLTEAEEDHKWRLEVVAKENAKRQSEFLASVHDLQSRKNHARKSHQEQVSTLVAEHKVSVANSLAINRDLEQQAKYAWQEICKAIDEENKLATEKAYREWKDAVSTMHRENEHLGRRRVELQQRIEKVEQANKDILIRKKAAWKEVCRQIEEGYEKNFARARIDYEQLLEEMDLRNSELLEAAKIAYQAKVAAVKTHNDIIRPLVEGSELVQKEINRIRLFLGYIVSQSNLPPAKNVKKRTLEQSLDMLSVIESPCIPEVIIAALQAAYTDDAAECRMSLEVPQGDSLDKDLLTGTRKNPSRFFGMTSIQPSRATAHFCG